MPPLDPPSGYDMPELPEAPAADQEGAQLEKELDEVPGDNAEKH